MGHIAGEPIKGHVHSADASSGVAVPFFNQGSKTARTLAENEYLEIHTCDLITVAGGDCYVIVGPDASVAAGEVVIRGTFAANGGEEKSHTLHVGKDGETVWVTAPAGVVDVTFTGVVRRAESNVPRPVWRESLVPGA